MMTDAPTGHFQSIVLQPHAGQFVIDELHLVSVCVAGLVYGGMEAMPLCGMATAVSLFLLLVLAYRFIYLRLIRYRIGGEQLVSETRASVAQGRLHGAIPYCRFSGTPKPAATALRAENGHYLLDGPEYAETRT